MARVKVEGDGGGGVGVSERSWRDSAIRSRLSYALEQEGFQKDVTFIVGEGGQITSAHRLILSLSSEYFDNLMREGGGGFISLSTVCPTMFKRLLKYIYTDEIENENFFHFLDFAKTFGFSHLDELCLESWLRTGITVENVIFILELERRRQSPGGCGDKEGKGPGLRDNCIDFIKRNADKVVRLDSFNEICQQDLAWILGLDDFVLEGGEFSVFLLALRWAKYQCRIGGCGVVGGETPINLRIVLGDVRQMIRYTLIPYPKLLLEVKSSGLLSSTEFIQVLKTFIDPTENPLGISTHPRKRNSGEQTPGQKNNPENYEPESKRKRIRTETSPSQGPTPRPLLVPVAPYSPLSPNPSLDIKSWDTISDVRSSQERDSVFRPGLALTKTVLTVATVLDSVTVTPHPLIMESDNFYVPESCPAQNTRLRAAPPPPSLNSAEYIRSNATLNWSDLIREIKHQRSTLTRIVLNNTAISGFDFGHDFRVVLRKLKTFHYSLNRVSQNTANQNPSLPDKTHPYFVNTEGFLFFDKSSRCRWHFSELPTIGVDIRISVKGINLMTISPTEKKIILSYPPSKEGDRILENCPSDTKILSLCCAEIKSPELIPLDSLEQLNLYKVEIHGMTPIRLINQCPILKHVSIYNSITQPEHFSQTFLISDFKKCRSTLKSLSLSKYFASGPSPKCLSKFDPFSALESLYLDCCRWNIYFSKHLSKSFPKLKRFGIRWVWKDKALTAALLKDALEQLKRLEFVSISLQKQDQHDAVNCEADEFNLYPRQEEDWIQNFLMEAAPAALKTSCASGPEDLLTQNIVLRKINGMWRRPRSGNDGTDMDKIHFKALKLDHFFDDVEMLKFL